MERDPDRFAQVLEEESLFLDELAERERQRRREKARQKEADDDADT